MKRWLLTLFLSVGLTWLACIRTDGFSLSVIAGPLISEPALSANSEVIEILLQPFHYLNKGRQCFVFESADRKFVIKFFNQKYLHIPWYSFLTGGKETAKRSLRRNFFENSYAIAYRELGDEILYLHLGRSHSLPKAALVDRASSHYSLDLNELPFVLQKKGIPIYDALDAIYEKEGLQGLTREIDSFLAAIAHRVSKNIADGDRDIQHNWGYVDGHLFQLDPGRLYYDDLSDPARRQLEWERATHDFQKWLSAHYPEAAIYFKAAVASI